MVEDVLTERFRLESVLVGKASAHKATLSAANGEFLQSLVEMAKDLPLRGRQALEALWSLAAAGRIEDLQTEGAGISGPPRSGDPEPCQFQPP